MKLTLVTYTLIALVLGACARMAPDSEISKEALKNVNTKGLFADPSSVKFDGTGKEFGLQAASNMVSAMINFQQQ